MQSSQVIGHMQLISMALGFLDRVPLKPPVCMDVGILLLYVSSSPGHFHVSTTALLPISPPHLTLLHLHHHHILTLHNDMAHKHH